MLRKLWTACHTFFGKPAPKRDRIVDVTGKEPKAFIIVGTPPREEQHEQQKKG